MPEHTQPSLFDAVASHTVPPAQTQISDKDRAILADYYAREERRNRAGKAIQQRWETWRNSNPEAFDLLLEMTYRLRQTCPQRGAMRRVVEEFRSTPINVNKGDECWKFPDNFISRLARDVVAHDPEQFRGWLVLHDLRTA